MNFEKLDSFCAFNITNTHLVNYFYWIGEGKNYYPELLNYLLTSGKTLSEEFHDLLVYSESPLVAACAKDPSPARIKAIEYDLSIIKELCALPPSELKGILNKDGDFPFLAEMPDYERGDFDYDVEYFLDFARKNGTGVFAKYRAFRFDKKLRPIEAPDKIKLSDLKNYETQRNQVIENTLCFINDKPAQNVLLYGDRGTGKSSTVKAVFNEYKELRMVEVARENVALLPKLYEKLRNVPMKFIITIDDLSFAENDDRFGILKAALEGSLAAKPDNILIYATTNRRKIIRETAADREISGADAIDESMSLSDRFGLFITFFKPDKQGYLDIVTKLCEDMGINVPEERLFAAAERFAVRRGGRSPRTAKQFAEWLKGRIELGLDY